MQYPFAGLFRRRKAPGAEIDPDQIFLDASNLPDFNMSQLEGRMEKPIALRAVIVLGGFFFLMALMFLFRLTELQIVEGAAYREQSEKNRLEEQIIFPERGVITDRQGVPLVTNAAVPEEDFAKRVYPERSGFGHVLGYVSYPKKDSSGNYFQTAYEGIEGVEKAYGSTLSGLPGTALVEFNALQEVQSQGVVKKPIPGSTLTLSIDARVQTKLYDAIQALATQVGFTGGAGAIMDVETGELLAFTSYPEFDSAILSEGDNQALIRAYVTDPAKPFLNRGMAGLYTPGSIVKPYVAIAALEEGVISPEKKIFSSGALTLPNPYTPSRPSIFRDWKAHGWVDMTDALAVSSNVYFFSVGGGFEDQPGLGIERLNTYFSLFGFGKKTGSTFGEEEEGLIPSVAWKAKVFPDEPWRVGDTYNTSIGQYSFQVTLLQALRGVAALANGGTLLTPTIVLHEVGKKESIPIDPKHFAVVREGMRQGVVAGTGAGLSIPGVAVASKSGTAELDQGKQYVNSWITGFFPYEKPRYAFAVVMEQGPRTNTIGGVFVMRQVLEYMVAETPEYIEVQ